jgi:hypothetical protein
MSWQFDGTTSRIFIPSGSWTLFPKEGWTISFWFKILGTGVNAHQHWFFHRSGASLTDANTISCRINESNNVMTSLSRSDSNAFLTSAYTPASNEEWTSSGWVHVVMTKTRSVCDGTQTITDDLSYGSLYVNGGKNDTDSDPNFDDLNAGFICFGKIGNAASARTLSGCLAEWAKWDRVLTPEEISRIYRGQSPITLNPTIYYPMRNDYIDRSMGLTGIGVNNIAILADHPPVGYKGYYPTAESTANLVSVYNRIGNLETKGFIDFVDWAPGQITATGCAQSGLLFSYARVGEAYQVAANATLSGCLPTCHVDTSGFLTISVRNPGNTAVTVGATRWNVFRL